jgi:hypothetical protein
VVLWNAITFLGIGPTTTKEKHNEEDDVAGSG